MCWLLFFPRNLWLHLAFKFFKVLDICLDVQGITNAYITHFCSNTDMFPSVKK